MATEDMKILQSTLDNITKRNAARNAAELENLGARAAEGARFGTGSPAATPKAPPAPKSVNPFATTVKDMTVKGAAGRLLFPAIAAYDTYTTDSEDYYKRFGFDRAETPAGEFAKDLAVRSLGFASDLGNVLTFGIPQMLGHFRDRQGMFNDPATDRNYLQVLSDAFQGIPVSPRTEDIAPPASEIEPTGEYTTKAGTVVQPDSVSEEGVPEFGLPAIQSYLSSGQKTPANVASGIPDATILKAANNAIRQGRYEDARRLAATPEQIAAIEAGIENQQSKNRMRRLERKANQRISMNLPLGEFFNRAAQRNAARKELTRLQDAETEASNLATTLASKFGIEQFKAAAAQQRTETEAAGRIGAAKIRGGLDAFRHMTTSSGEPIPNSLQLIQQAMDQLSGVQNTARQNIDQANVDRFEAVPDQEAWIANYLRYVKNQGIKDMTPEDVILGIQSGDIVVK